MVFECFVCFVLLSVIVLEFIGDVFDCPETFYYSKTLPKFSHRHIRRADVHRTVATATFAKSMCTEHSPQQHVQNRCAQDLSQSNSCRADVH